MPNFDENTIFGYFKGIIEGDIKADALKTTDNHNVPGWTEIRRESGWHKLGEYPDALFCARHPNENAIWDEWKRKNYQPISKASYNKSVISTTAVVTETNYFISWPDEKDHEDLFVERNYLGWLRENVLKDKMPLDPNAVFLAFPVLDESLDANNEVVGGVIDVERLLIDSAQIHNFKPSRFISWKSYEKSIKVDGQEGDIWFVADGFAIWRATEVRNTGKFEKKWIIDLYYVHDTGVIWQPIGGIKEYREGKCIYRNFYGAYFPFADDALRIYIDAHLVSKTTAHPIPIMKAQPCTKCSGTGTLYKDQDGYDGQIAYTCDARGCADGDIVKFTYPGAVIVRPRLESSDPGAEFDVQVPELEFVQPPIEANKALDDKWMMLLDEAEKALNLRFIQEAQSGTAKEADRTDQLLFTAMVSSWVWGEFTAGVFTAELKIKHGADWERFVPEIKTPTQFKLRSEAELLDEMKMMDEANLPVSIRGNIINEFVNKRWSNNPSFQRKMKITAALDPLFIVDPETQTMLRNTGGASDEDIFRSNRTMFVIESLVEEMGVDVLENDLKWWMDQFDKAIKVMIPPPPPPIAESLI